MHDGDRKFFNVLTKIISCCMGVTCKDVLERSAHPILVIMSSLKLMQCFFTLNFIFMLLLCHPVPTKFQMTTPEDHLMSSVMKCHSAVSNISLHVYFT